LLFSLIYFNCQKNSFTEPVEFGVERVDQNLIDYALIESKLRETENEEFWTTPDSNHTIVDSVLIKEYANKLDNHEPLILRLRQLKFSSDEATYYELNSYNGDYKVKSTKYIKYEKLINKKEDIDIEEILNFLKIKVPSYWLLKALEPKSCVWDWRTTPVMPKGLYYEHKNFGGYELRVNRPSTSWTLGEWYSGINEFYTYNFDNKMSSCFGTAEVKTLYCEEEDILKRRFIYTRYIKLCRHPYYDGHVMTPYYFIPYWNGPPFTIACDPFSTWCTDFSVTDYNDVISLILARFRVEEKTY